MRWRNMLFSANKEAVKESFLKYVDSIMSSSYLNGEEMTVARNCCDGCQNVVVDIEESNDDPMDQLASSILQERRRSHESMEEVVEDDTMDSNTTTTSNLCCQVCEKFVDVDVGSEKEQEQLQRIRDTRSKYLNPIINGKILDCRDCGKTFSTQDIVEMSLRYYKNVAEKDTGNDLPDNTTITMTSHRRDIACYTYPYERQSLKRSGESTSFYNTKEVRGILMRWRFDEHDFSHRPACFKNGNECRFFLAKQYCQNTTLHVEEVEIEKSNVVTWHLLDRPKEDSVIETTPYMIETMRSMGSQYINTHSKEVADVFACNTNVQLGESGHLYYASLYTTKDTQKEDSERFRRIGTQVITRIMRERYLAAENARLENREPDARGPDFGEGLSMLLSGMNANMNKAICSATMAHLLINSKDGQRFEFSHEFTNILVGQMEDVLEGKEGHFRIRTNRSKSKQIVRWPDSSVDDYIHRPDELEDISLYEFNARFHKVCKTFKEMNTAKVELLNLVSSEAMEDSDTGNGESDDNNDNNSDDNDGDDDGIEVSKTTNYKFQQSHPGFEFSHLKERKHPSMPVISLPKDDGLCPIKDLQIFTDDPSEPIQKSRERYAKLSLLMFYPFRELNDLKGNNGTFWSKFKSILAHLSTVDDATTAPDLMDIDSPTFYKYGIDILHNIDERNALHTMKRATEPLLKRTCYKENENEEESSAINRDDSDNDSGARDFTQYESNEADADASGLLGEISQQFERSSNSIIERGDVSREFMIGARINNQDSLLVEDEDATQTPATPVPTNSTPIYSQSAGTQNNFSQVIQLFLGTLVGSNSETYIEYVQSAQANDSESSTASVNSNTDNGVFQNGGEQIAVPTLKSVALTSLNWSVQCCMNRQSPMLRYVTRFARITKASW